MKFLLTLFILTLAVNAHSQDACPSKKSTVLPGMLEELCPIDTNLIGTKEYYLDKKLKMTADAEKAVYRFSAPTYSNQDIKGVLPKFGKAKSHSPHIDKIKDGIIHGEVIYRAKGSFWHVTFNHGRLMSISQEGAIAEHWQSYTDLSRFDGKDAKWIRKEIYNHEGNISKIQYWYSCDEEIKIGKWKKYE